MPKSKRDKKVSLTKTTKKGLLMKQQIIEDIRSSVEKYSSIYLFTVNNMRNAKLKDLRMEWRDSRFYFGKNKVMAKALGTTEAEEVDSKLSLLSKRLQGQCGLLFTSRKVKEVLDWFKEFSDEDYAKSGFTATEEVKLSTGPLEGFAFSIEPHLRQLGLPTALEKGVIVLRKEHVVCKKGSALTPEQARILKLLDLKMAVFKLNIKYYWEKSSGFHKVDESVESDAESEADEEMEEENSK